MKAQTVINGLKHLPPTAEILPKLREMLRNADSSIQDVISLIKLDPSLASQIVRVSNSSFYSSGSQCHNLEQAIYRIGFNEVYKLVVFIASNKLLSGTNNLYGYPPNKLWEESVSCATILLQIAPHAGEDKDTAYTIGLLHAIGKMALDSYFKNSNHKAPTRTFKQDDPDAERKLIGVDHAELGAELLQRWNFLEDITEPTRNQYDPSVMEQYRKMGLLLQCSKNSLPYLDLTPQEISQQFCSPDEVKEHTDTTDEEWVYAIISAKAMLYDIHDMINDL